MSLPHCQYEPQDQIGPEPPCSLSAAADRIAGIGAITTTVSALQSARADQRSDPRLRLGGTSSVPLIINGWLSDQEFASLHAISQVEYAFGFVPEMPMGCVQQPSDA